MSAWQNSAEGRQLSALQHENAELRMELDLKQKQLSSGHSGDALQPQPNGRALAPGDLPPADAGGSLSLSSLLRRTAGHAHPASDPWPCQKDNMLQHITACRSGLFYDSVLHDRAVAGAAATGNGMPTLQARPLLPAPLQVATAAAAVAPAPPMLQRQISAGAQMVQTVASLQTAQQQQQQQHQQPDAAAASSESLKAHANALKVGFLNAILAPLLLSFSFLFLTPLLTPPSASFSFLTSHLSLPPWLESNLCPYHLAFSQLPHPFSHFML